MIRALVLVAGLLALAASASGETAIYFDPAAGEVDASSDVVYCTEVWIGPALDVKGYSIEITFSTADLNLFTVVEGDVFSSAGHLSAFFYAVRPGAVEDTIAIDASDLTGSVAGPGHLFTICFGPPWVCAGDSPLSAILADVRDSGNAPIPVAPTGGTVTVSCATGTDETTWGGIKGLYR
jgi:hypothetical protein